MAKRTEDMKRRAGELLSANMVAVVAAGAVVVIALLVAIPVMSASTPAFLSHYRELSTNYENLQTSAHKGLACTECHAEGQNRVAQTLAVTADFYAGLVTNQKTPRFTTYAPPTNAACMRCHETEWSDESTRTLRVPHPAHPRLASETRECVKCHKWTAHEETYMQKHKTMPFSGVCVAYGCHVGTKKTSECGQCHHSLVPGDWKAEHPKVVQTAGPNGCLENCHEIDQCRQCHTTGKTPNVNGVKVATGLETIQSAHVKPDWIEKHGAIAQTQQAQCLKCHVSDGECKECHARRPAFHGPQSTWIGTHKNVAKNNEKRCITACHEKKFCDDCHKQFKEMR